ncbi:HEPN domain-containing protein [Ectothiorhodospiraceae bacterium WFHF3C12]|nr:HEPN domain-containing protein [Ectothiorhodospiraceae bacterium WFHF3C12]
MEQKAPGLAYQAYMRTDLSYLPEHKREELAWIVDMIREHADVELIVLFGSYARDEWVEDRYVEDGVTYEYLSDYDLMVVLDLKHENGRGEKWRAVEQRIRRHPGIKTPVTLLTEGSEHLNRELERGQYFYTDVIREGVLLFDAGRMTLGEPRVLDAGERAEVAHGHFSYWYRKGEQAIRGFRMYFEEGVHDDAAFLLHQATERFYFALILVFTDYKPKTHDIEKLHSQAAMWVPELVRLFPRATKFEEQAFKRLKQAYIDARFDKEYAITREELNWLAGQVERLKAVTEDACRARLAHLRAS